MTNFLYVTERVRLDLTRLTMSRGSQNNVENEKRKWKEQEETNDQRFVRSAGGEYSPECWSDALYTSLSTLVRPDICAAKSLLLQHAIHLPRGLKLKHLQFFDSLIHNIMVFTENLFMRCISNLSLVCLIIWPCAESSRALNGGLDFHDRRSTFIRFRFRALSCPVLSFLSCSVLHCMERQQVLESEHDYVIGMQYSRRVNPTIKMKEVKNLLFLYIRSAVL